MTDSGASKQNPLIPMSEMFMSNTTGGEHSKDVRQQFEQQTPKKGSMTYTQEVIDSEIASLRKIQSTNNDEIKKRLMDIQSLRENNLVVVGALGGLKKMKESLNL
ncbi:unnamed protein product [Sphacelaria rigidula]